MKILKSTEISAFGGINFVFKHLQDYSIENILNENLPVLCNQSKYSWKDILYSILSIYLCGGDCIEDLHTHLKVHFKNNPFLNLPSPDRVLARLKELAQDSKYTETKRGSVLHEYNTNTRLFQLNISLLKNLGVFKSKEITLDYDNTIIFNEKSDSKMTYKRNYGYQPGVCTINEEQVLYVENRNGNSDAKSFQSETIARIFNQLKTSKIKKVNHFRADAASYQYDVVKVLNENVKWFYIGCRNSYIEKYFTEVKSWEKCNSFTDGIMEVGEIYITPFAKQAKSQKEQPEEYRLVVKRKQREDNQLNLFTQDAYEYRAILTNNFTYTAKEVVVFYNHRGNMERQFDILKNDFGWNNMPFSNLKNNTVFLYLTAMCRNIYSKIITVFSSKYKYLNPTFRVKKFLFRFIILPAKWIKKARQMQLRIYSQAQFFT